MRKKLDPRSLPGIPTPQQLRESFATTYPDFSRASVTPGDDYTTSGSVGWETVYAADGETVSLHQSPQQGQRVTVFAGGAVTIDTAGTETVDGGSSLTLAAGESYTLEAVFDGTSTNYEVLAERLIP